MSNDSFVNASELLSEAENNIRSAMKRLEKTGKYPEATAELMTLLQKIDITRIKLGMQPTGWTKPG